jgi:hypothetical protein
MDLGPNIGVALVEVSESGARLRLSAEVKAGQEVSLTMDRPTGWKPVKRLGIVKCAVPSGDGTFIVDIEMRKYLQFAEVTYLAHC